MELASMIGLSRGQTSPLYTEFSDNVVQSNTLE
jgi:hypothetical protein